MARNMRRTNWDVCLIRFASVAKGQAFEWGRTDCAHLARRALFTMLGRDPWDGYVGKWKTRRGALTVAKRTAYPECLNLSGAVEVGDKYATSGDIAVGPTPDRHGMVQMAVVLPGRMAMTSSPDKGVIVDRLHGFKVGTRFWRYV